MFTDIFENIDYGVTSVDLTLDDELKPRVLPIIDEGRYGKDLPEEQIIAEWLEIIAEEARWWNVVVQEMEGGILGEEEEDRKAKLLEDDAAYKRAPTLGAKGRDRTSFPPWMRKEIWSGPFEPLLGEEGSLGECGEKAIGNFLLFCVVGDC